MSFEQRINKGRTSYHTVPLYEADGSTAINLASTDVVRYKIYRRAAATPLLDLDSAAASANGSSVTVDATSPASVTVRINAADATMDPGVYRGEVSVVDDSDSDTILAAETGVVYVGDSGGGDTGLT